MQSWPLAPGGPVIGGAVPLVCVPIVARTASEMLEQAHALMQQPYLPDIVELRADHLHASVADIPAVLRQLQDVLVTGDSNQREENQNIPILFTNRSGSEGGPGIWPEPVRIASIFTAVQSGQVALVDIELATPEDSRTTIIHQAQAAGVGVIISAHDFRSTPDDVGLADLFARLLTSGGDIAKLAVSATTPGDALRLLRATALAARTARIPLTSMAMGSHGAITRLSGSQFGSCLTYASAGILSAPGQLPMAEIREFWQRVGLRPA